MPARRNERIYIAPGEELLVRIVAIRGPRCAPLVVRDFTDVQEDRRSATELRQNRRGVIPQRGIAVVESYRNGDAFVRCRAKDLLERQKLPHCSNDAELIAKGILRRGLGAAADRM